MNAKIKEQITKQNQALYQTKSDSLPGKVLASLCSQPRFEPLPPQHSVVSVSEKSHSQIASEDQTRPDQNRTEQKASLKPL